MQSLVLLLLALTSATTAQFGFFEQMFGGHEHHRQPQNVPSDSTPYRQNYDGCMFVFIIPLAAASSLSPQSRFC
jgi:hypothetical protein